MMTDPLNPHLDPDILNAFTDGELPLVEAQATREHLAQCHRCALLALSTAQLKAETARAGRRYAPPAEAMARMAAQLRPQPAARAILPFPARRVAWPGVAATLLLTASILSVRELHQTRDFEAELLDQHLAVLSSNAEPQVISSDRHTVKPWFQGKLPFSFNLPEPGNLPPDTTLIGGDLAYLKGKQAALLLFTIHKHKVSVFLTQKDGASFSRTSRRNGFTEISASAGELSLVAVSDVNPDELNALVRCLVGVQ